ncbi:MAG TPA: hypothetical protein VJU87_04675 [Gemmatimonadaceae bacterium]|nr:hypothetical protein [Gemmatimonadaceae bacterium]
MTVRTFGLVAGAMALGGLIAACAGTEPSAPRAVRSDQAAAAPMCSPDVVAPVISSVAASPNVLWPPNHKYVPVTVSWSASDNCTPTPNCGIASVSSNEPVNGLGDGNTAPDWIVTSPSTVSLRAERSGTGTGRVYTIGVTCSDAAGNTSSPGLTSVRVPHDQGHG